MAALDMTRPFATNSGFGATATCLFAAVANWNDARVTRKALSQLTARELDDIGLVPGDIDAIATRATY